jgi:glycosyltransferase involved in cell wall biosynthesis
MTMGAAAARGCPEISICIPCYNEEDNVVQIHAAVSKELAGFVESYEILFIDNCSTDGTQALIRKICAGDPNTRAIFNNRNYGQMRSPTYAIYQAEGEAVIAMCADFQDPPEMIRPMIEQWRAGAQIVLGQRRSEEAAFMTRLSRKLGYYLLGRLADYPIIPGATGFGLFDRMSVDTLAGWNEPEPFFRGMVIEGGFRIAVLPFDRPKRAAGETKNGPMALIDFAISGLAGSAKSLLRSPLIGAVYVGIISVIALLAGLVALTLGSSGAWTILLFSAQLIMFSTIMLFLGLMGEQIRAISERTRNVPLVIESERLNFPDDRKFPSSRTIVQHSRVIR